MVDLAGVRWIGATRNDVAEALGVRLGLPVRIVADDRYQTFRQLLAELGSVEAECLIVAGRLAPPAVAAVLRDPRHAVFLTDDRSAGDARILRLQTLPPDATADAVAEALGFSGAGGTSP